MKGWMAGLLVFVLALGLRLAYVHEHYTVLGLDANQLVQTDNYVFALWAGTIADGDWLCRDQPHAFHHWTQEVAPESRWDEWYGGRATYHQSPLYPYVVALVYRFLGREPQIVGYAQSVLGALACWLTYLLGTRLVSRRAGLFAGLLLAFMAPYYFFDAFVLRDGFMVLVVVLATLALDAAVTSGRTRDWLLAGASLGVFTLAKETGTPLLLLTLFGLGLWLRRQPVVLLRAAAFLVIGWALVTTPAFVRNVVVGAPTFQLSTRGPEVLIAGNARGQDGVSWEPPIDLMRGILMESNFSMGHAALLTLATHRPEPTGFLALVWTKTAAYLNGYEVPNNVNFDLHRAHLVSLKVGFVSMTFLAPAAILGLFLGLRHRRRLAVLYLMFGVISASIVALYILARFRLQALPLMAVFAALTLDWVWTSLAAGRRAAVAAAAVPFALLTWFCWPAVDAASLYNERTRNAMVMLQLAKVGNFPQAMRYREIMFQQQQEEDGVGEDSELHERLQAIAEAFESFERHGRLPPDDARHYLELGRGYTALIPVTKRADMADFVDLARNAYRRARQLDPELEGVHHGFGRIELELTRHWQFGRRDMNYGPALHAFLQELERYPLHGPSRRDAGLIRFGWNMIPEALVDLLLADHVGAADASTLAAVAAISVNPLYGELGTVRVLEETVPVYEPQRGLIYGERALAAAPGDPNVLDQVSLVLYVHRRFDESVALIERLIELQPWRTRELTGRRDAFRDYQSRVVERAAAEPATPDEPDGYTPAPDAPSAAEPPP